MTALSRLPLISLLVVLCLLACFRPVHANVEKTIFLAPARITLPNVHPGLDDLCLNRLSPAHPRISRALPVKFPADDSPRGSQHWLLLEQLQPGKRYEVRICWVATVCLLLFRQCYVAARLPAPTKAAAFGEG